MLYTNFIYKYIQYIKPTSAFGTIPSQPIPYFDLDPVDPEHPAHTWHQVALQ